MHQSIRTRSPHLLSTVTLLLAVSAISTAQEVSPITSRLQFLAELLPDTTTSGPVFLDLRVRNISESEVRLQDSSVAQDFQIEITIPGQRIAPLSPKVRSRGAILRNTISALAPGEEERKTLELSDYFDLSRPATYEIKVTRKGVFPMNPEDRTTERVVSNPVVLTVVAPSGVRPARSAMSTGSNAEMMRNLRTAFESSLPLQIGSFSRIVSVTAGEPVIVTLDIQNTSGRTIGFERGQEMEKDLRVLIHHPNDERTGSVQPAWSTRGMSALAYDPIDLAPGQTLSRAILLNDWGTFREPGQYEVSVSMAGAAGTAEFLVTVTPAQESRLRSLCESLFERIQIRYDDTIVRYLGAVSHEMVVPYLARIAERNGMPAVLDALARHDTVPAADALLALRTSSNPQVAALIDMAIKTARDHSKSAEVKARLANIP